MAISKSAFDQHWVIQQVLLIISVEMRNSKENSKPCNRIINSMALPRWNSMQQKALRNIRATKWTSLGKNAFPPTSPGDLQQTELQRLPFYNNSSKCSNLFTNQTKPHFPTLPASQHSASRLTAEVAFQGSHTHTPLWLCQGCKKLQLSSFLFLFSATPWNLLHQFSVFVNQMFLKYYTGTFPNKHPYEAS